MEDHALRASKSVHRAENEFQSLLAQREPSLAAFEGQLAKLRSVCQDFIFCDFEAATEEKVESRLWEAHAKVNQKFRPVLAKFRDDDGNKKKHVERRKAEKLYLEFIKSSMRFYRGYIQRLASHFTGASEVLEVARKFGLNTLTTDKPHPIDLPRKKTILKSCYVTLVQLGDLSRYRETELQSKERNWGPAKGYYDLAIDLDPTTGTAYNQLAVIALSDKDHLRAVYYLYRAISVEKPAPLAGGNLDLEFRKLRTRGISKSASSDEAKGNQDLYHRFVMFHARALAHESCVGVDEQADVLRKLAEDLKERPYDTSVRKFCLINIAAEDHAARRADAETLTSFKILHHFNVGTFFVLLKLLLEELQNPTKDVEVPNPKIDYSRLTPVTRRILPHLRLYSAWLLSSVQVLLHEGADSLKVPAQELWIAYAEALSLLVATFPILEINDIPYLLDEDQDTLAFTPFSDVVKQYRFMEKGQAKPAHDATKTRPRSVDDEMLYRIKTFVRDGILLCSSKIDTGNFTIPITFAGNRFNYYEPDSLRSQPSFAAAVQGGKDSAAGNFRDRVAGARTSTLGNESVPLPSQDDISDAGASTSTMENMVDDLTGPARNDRENLPPSVSFLTSPQTPTLISPTAPIFADRAFSLPQPSTFTARDLVQQIQQSSPSLTPLQTLPNHRTSLPSIWNSPFAPLPGENPGASPRPRTALRDSMHSPLSTQLNSSGHFQANLAPTQHQVPMRSSPVDSFQPAISPKFGTPWSRGNDISHPSSPWQPTANSLHTPQTVIERKVPEASPFGAIGEPRRK